MRYENWGQVPYAEAWRRQLEYVDRRAADEIPDTIVFVEHPTPVVTLGRGAQREGGRARYVHNPEVEVFEIERGGLATYHGPGQLVIYPIVKLQGSAPGSFRGGVVGLIRSLEDAAIRWLETRGLVGGRIVDKTGVWVHTPVVSGSRAFHPERARKIASIGIAVRRWVSYHGMALNLSTGSQPWTWLDPCGFEAGVMTDLKSLTGQDLKAAEVANYFVSLGLR